MRVYIHLQTGLDLGILHILPALTFRLLVFDEERKCSERDGEDEGRLVVEGQWVEGPVSWVAEYSMGKGCMPAVSMLQQAPTRILSAPRKVSALPLSSTLRQRLASSILLVSVPLGDTEDG